MSGPPWSYGLLSSAPPTLCGIATFGAALGRALEDRGATVTLVRAVDDPATASDVSWPAPVTLVASQPRTIRGAVAALNRHDLVIVQHEYGLYGGEDGADVLDVLAGLQVPSIAVLHTVLASPTPHQREVLNGVVRTADVVVVMSETAARTLRAGYDVGDTPVVMIPHGAAVATPERTRRAGARPQLLTWGLLGPGKGIEWAIDAIALLDDIEPAPQYLVAGRTHPKVLATEGERYRHYLMRRVRELGLEDQVTFDNAYRDLSSLHELIQGADLVVLPYDSADQATSGVLVDALAAGKPVVATAFPHAVELLRSGAGSVVRHRDARALADALRPLLETPALLADMADDARRQANALSWPAVAAQYDAVADSLSVRIGATL